jgi:DNA-binding MarR family transcriptional regulator
MQYNRAVKKTKIKIPTKLSREAVAHLKDTYRDIMIVLAFREGISITDIAKVHKVDKSTVSRIVNSNKDLLDLMQ